MSSKVKSDVEKKPTKNQPELAKHDASTLDLAFIMDCTASMGPYILNATEVNQNTFMNFDYYSTIKILLH